MNGCSAADHDASGDAEGLTSPHVSRAGGLAVDAAAAEAAHAAGRGPPGAVRAPPGVRGPGDLRSPGAEATPTAADGRAAADPPDFVTQTDRHGRATTPRSAGEGDARGGGEGAPREPADAYESLLEGFRSLCCCLAPGDDGEGGTATARGPDGPVAYSTRGPDAPLLLEGDSALRHGDDPRRLRLLGGLHPDDAGKKCLVLDLDETLVHSSFREVAGADFILPVQIEDVIHHVYVAKRPGVDEFLVEMARHYEVVVYTASLNKYADPLLDLLDPLGVVRTRLFRESCVFYAGNFVKDLSLLNRPLESCVLVDNSPASYLFHPENAIDCTSFIDDPHDRELEQIAEFLIGIKDVEDVRGIVQLWRRWPDVDLSKTHKT